MPHISEADYTAMIKKTVHLEAENASLHGLLKEYAAIATMKQHELQQHEAGSIEIKMNFENQYAELQSKKNYISNLLQKEAAALLREEELERQAGNSVSAHYSLDNAKIQHDHLQAQLIDLSERLKQLNIQCLSQQQSSSRAAELESLLENAAEEIERLKNPPEEDDESDKA